LERAGALAQAGPAEALVIKEGRTKVDLELQRQAVELVTLTWQ
jgi:hypothetical protein